MKTKKIGIRFTLQQSLGFELIAKDGDPVEKEEPKFSVYAQITYNRKNTKFKIANIEYTKSQFLGEEGQNELREIESRIKKVVELEVISLAEKFTLKGLGKRFEKYDESVFHGLYSSVYQDIMNRVVVIKDGGDGTSKEQFFIAGILGYELLSAFDSDTKANDKLYDAIVGIEQIGSMLLERSRFNFIFTEDIKTGIETIVNLHDNSPNYKSIFEMSILSWLEDNVKHGEIESINRVNRLLFKYVLS